MTKRFTIKIAHNGDFREFRKDPAIDSTKVEVELYKGLSDDRIADFERDLIHCFRIFRTTAKDKNIVVKISVE